MKSLERRIETLEEAAGGLPCKKPGHNDLFLFVIKYSEKELNAETQAKIDSIRACPKCKNELVILLMHFGTAAEETASIERERPSINFVFGEERQ